MISHLVDDAIPDPVSYQFEDQCRRYPHHRLHIVADDPRDITDVGSIEEVAMEAVLKSSALLRRHLKGGHIKDTSKARLVDQRSIVEAPGWRRCREGPLTIVEGWAVVELSAIGILG